jgi:hypothetical protein
MFICSNVSANITLLWTLSCVTNFLAMHSSRYSKERASLSWLLTVLDNETDKKVLVNICRAVNVMHLILLLLIQTL